MTSEEALISCLLVAESANSIIGKIPFLLPEHFADSLMGEVYRIFATAHEHGKEENFFSIHERLGDIASIPTSDIEARLTELLRQTPTSIGAERYAENVLREYRRRTARSLLEGTSFSFENLDEEISALIEGLTELQGLDREECGMSVADMAVMYRYTYPKDAKEMGLKTGIEGLDNLLGGTNGGDLCFIGARPSAGKSAFANQLSRKFESIGKKVGFFNLEMQRDSVYERLLANQSRVSLGRIRGAVKATVWEEEDIDRANNALQKIHNLIYYTGTFTTTKIRQIVERDKLDVVIIDYLQLVRSGGRYNNRASEVGEISHAVKAIAMDFNIPIFPLVQLNRAVELRDDKEPTLSDIRESGDIEQDASQVIFLWTVPNPNNKDDTSTKGCRVAKNRNGQLGNIKLKFDGETMRFKEMPVEEPSYKSAQEKSRHFSKPLPDQLSIDDYPVPFAEKED